MKQSKIPVIIVPADAVFSSVENVMLLCDYEHLTETLPDDLINKFLTSTGAKLHVLNVSAEEDNSDSENLKDKEFVAELFKDQNAEFHFLKNTDYIGCIHAFVEEHQINLVITVPKKHGFFEGLFHEGHSKKLAFHTHVPLMGVHKNN